MVELEQLIKQNTTELNQNKISFTRKINLFLCRLLDIVASSFGLLILSPLFLFLAIKIKADTPGPVYFRGQRMGKNGIPFEIIKFRTMYETPASYQGNKVTAAGDNRITPFGQWLRDTKINELPQLINILRGDMSLVGPRPEDVDIANTWSEKQKQVLFSARPGLTSPASVVYRNEEKLLSHDDSLEQYFNEILPDKMRLDMLYVLQRNILSDIDVIFCTLLVLLPGWRKIQLCKWELYYGPLTRFINRFAIWFLTDTILAIFSIALISIFYRFNSPLNVGWVFALLYALAFAFFFSISNLLLNLYAIEWSRAPSHLAGVLVFSALVGMISINMLQMLLRAYIQPLPLIVVISAAILTWGLAVAVRYRERLITTIASRWLEMRGGVHRVTENVLIIGAGRNAAAVQWLFSQSNANTWFRIVGLVDDEHTLQQLRVGNIRVLGTTEQIPELVKKHDIGLICFTIQNISDSNRSRILNLCAGTGVRTVEMPDFFAIMGEVFTHHKKTGPLQEVQEG